MLAKLLVTLLLIPQTRPTEAVAAARAALDETIARQGQDGRAAAAAWGALGRALLAASDAAGAVDAYRHQLAIYEKTQERPSDLVALVTCRLELGNALRNADLVTEALELYELTGPLVAQVEKSGLSDVRRATLRLGFLSGHAQALCIAGENLAATPLLEEALDVAVRGLGHDHPNTQVVRQSLAATLALTGQVDRACELAAQALASAEARGGLDDLKTAHAAHVSGTFLRVAGRTDEAVPLLERALRVRRKQLGDDHAATIGTLHSLAQAQLARHDFTAARPSYEALLAQSRRVLGESNLSTLHVECELAELLTELGDAAAALPLAKHSLEGRLAAYGPRHHHAVCGRLTMARIYNALERDEEAIAELELALAADDRADPDLTKHIRARLTVFLPALGREKEALGHAHEILRTFPRLLASTLPALLDAARVEFVKRNRQALDQILSWSLSPEDVAAAHRAAIGWKAQVARGLFAQRTWLRRNLDAAACARLDELARVLAALATAEQSGDVAARTRLTRQRRKLEQALSARAEGAFEPADPAAVYARLSPGDALIDLYVYERSDRQGAIGQHLVAFVVAAGETRPVRVDLGPLAPVAAATMAHLSLAARRAQAPTPAGRAIVDSVSATARELLWKPLATHVAGARRLFICADGPTALLPFATLPGDEPGTFLIERFEVRSLVSPLDLLPRSREPAANAKVVVLGDVEYGPSPGTPHFVPLPGAADEIAAIAKVLAAHAHEVVKLRGSAASSQGLAAAVPGARLVHLATHGEFRAQGREDTLPGQCAGVALAGANARGLFTADEVAWLDLRACELVVLSACDTGVGEPAVGEHVLGLRRALRLAGAAATVTSAWRVDDAATRALMVDFYGRMLGGAEPGAALRAAQLAMLGQNRVRGGDGLPGLWGAFVMEGR